MAQTLFSANTTPNLAALDANFSELYQAIFSYAYLAKAGLDSAPASIGTRVIGGTGLAGGFRLGLGLNVGFDGANWRTGADGSSNGGCAILTNYGSGAMEFHVFGSTGGASQTIANAAMLSVMTLDSAGFQAQADNAKRLGNPSQRWSTIYAGTGAINTSDAREKTAVQPLTVAELAAAKELAREIGSYQWLASVQAKGGDARVHIGMTVQRAMAIMSAHGLDPMRYGFICHDAWAAEVDPATGATTRPAGDRYAFRPDELLMFVARGFEARLAALEAQA